MPEITFPHVWGVSWSPTEDRLILVSNSGTVNLLDFKTKKFDFKIEIKNLTDLCWSNDGSKIAFIDGSRFLRVYSAKTGKLLQQFGPVCMEKIAWAKDGKNILVQGPYEGWDERFVLSGK